MPAASADFDEGGRPIVKNPLTEALKALTGVDPPEYTHGAFTCQQLDDKDIDALQSWCVWNARPGWSTGIGILDAAEVIVREAVLNGNIAGDYRLVETCAEILQRAESCLEKEVEDL